MLMLYLFIGIFAGTLAGLLGVGGGIIVVPILSLMFRQNGMFTGFDIQVAVGSSVAVILVNTFIAMWTHNRHKSVSWPLCFSLTPGLVLGAVAGAYLNGIMSTHILRVILSAALFVTAVWMLWLSPVRSTRKLPGVFILSGGALVVGAVAALLGIGGGVMLIPWLRRYEISFRTLIGTAAACGVPLAITALCGHLWLAAAIPPQFGLTGHVYWPAVAGIVLSSVATIPLATRISHRVSQKRLQQIFALVLLAIALRMMWELPLIQNMVN